MIKPWIAIVPIAFLIAAPHARAANTAPYQQAKELRVKQCLSSVNNYSNHYLETANHGIDANSKADSADSRLLSFFVSKGHFWGDSQVNMQFVPNVSGDCDVVVTETFVAEKSCEAILEEQFPKWKLRTTLNGKTSVLQSDKGEVSVYLTPAGIAKNLCMVTRREVGYS